MILLKNLIMLKFIDLKVQIFNRLKIMSEYPNYVLALLNRKKNNKMLINNNINSFNQNSELIIEENSQNSFEDSSLLTLNENEEILQLRSLISDLRKENRDLKNQNRKYLNQIKDIKNNLTNEEINKFKSLLDETNEKYRNLQTKFEISESNVNILENQINNLNNEIKIKNKIILKLKNNNFENDEINSKKIFFYKKPQINENFLKIMKQNDKNIEKKTNQINFLSEIEKEDPNFDVKSFDTIEIQDILTNLSFQRDELLKSKQSTKKSSNNKINFDEDEFKKIEKRIFLLKSELIKRK